MVKEMVAFAPIGSFMTGVVEFDGAEDGVVLRITNDEVEVFCTDFGKGPAPGFAVHAFADFYDIAEADLTVDSIIFVYGFFEGFEEFKFGVGEEGRPCGVGVAIRPKRAED